MNILVMNAGSSSLKYQLIDMTSERCACKGVVERIGLGGSFLKHKKDGGEITAERKIKTHKEAVQLVLETLLDPVNGSIKSVSEIDAVGHRVVHSAEDYAEHKLIDDGVLAVCKKNSELAPLHNPANIEGIAGCRAVMPDTPMAAVFDTVFHARMPKHAFLYALPYEMYSDLRIRRYGFHGVSHEYVANEAAKLLKRDIKNLKIVTCHLGNGSSVCAVKGGVSIDTSMGFTPTEGVPMGTRSGNIDPAIHEFLITKKGYTIEKLGEVLNKSSGVLGVSGVSSDFRDLIAASESGNERASLALEIFAYNVRKFIGAYAAAMGGVDAVVFTAGIGENNPLIRGKCVEGLGFLGLEIDEHKNETRGTADISAAKSRAKILVIPTNEELAIARETKRLIDERG